MINYDKFKNGEKIFLLSTPYSITNGILNSLRLADEIPNMGEGFRVFQYSASSFDNYDGGVLVDNNGSALGITILKELNTFNTNFEISLSNVDGLVDTINVLKSYGNEKHLATTQLPSPSNNEAATLTTDQILKRRKFYLFSNSELVKNKTIREAFEE